METKEVKIQVPEGYEIDKENSTFEYIKFKPIKKNITYEDICEKLFKDSYHFIDGGGLINLYTGQKYKFNKNNASNHQQLKRILALNQLLNIAEYYNAEVEIKCNLYLISYNTITEKYEILSDDTNNIFGSNVYFYNKQDARAVIDNPNFREILDTIYKN